MGREIRSIAQDCGCEVVSQLREASDWKAQNVKDVDVVVDFSSSQGLRAAIEWCTKHHKPLVSGSTGLDKRDRAGLEKAGNQIPLLYSGNMSLGIAVLNSMIKTLGAVEDWDFQIEEVHHRHKKDKPSGTALLLQENLIRAVGRKVPDPQSLRGGGVPGIHTVWAMGQDEVLVLQHTAFNRQVFARGALRAARWLFDKDEPGLYDLTDLYQVNSKEP